MLIYLLKEKFPILAPKALKLIPTTAKWTHEVDAEVVNARLSRVGVQFCMAANTYPHSIRLAEIRAPMLKAAPALQYLPPNYAASAGIGSRLKGILNGSGVTGKLA